MAGSGGGVRARRGSVGLAVPPAPQLLHPPWTALGLLAPSIAARAPAGNRSRGGGVEAARLTQTSELPPAAAAAAAAAPRRSAGTLVRGEYEVSPGRATIVLVGREQCGIRGETAITIRRQPGGILSTSNDARPPCPLMDDCRLPRHQRRSVQVSALPRIPGNHCRALTLESSRMPADFFGAGMTRARSQ